MEEGAEAQEPSCTVWKGSAAWMWCVVMCQGHTLVTG